MRHHQFQVVKRACAVLCMTALLCTLFTGCNRQEPSTKISGSSSQTTVRDNTPQVLSPQPDGITVSGNDSCTIDSSHTDQGYVMIDYNGEDENATIQIKTPDDNTYIYIVSQDSAYQTFPLTGGDGQYTISVLEHIAGDEYYIIYSTDLDVHLADDLLPYLYPNQYSWFTEDSAAVSKGMELAMNASDDLEVISDIYHYIIQNISYDNEKAKIVEYGYLPDVDETLSSKKGICFDYVSLITCMLRSQRIPTRLEIGYAGEVYHAWISTYIPEIGWVDNIIEFNGKEWTLMDPTYASSVNASTYRKYTEQEDYYKVKYIY